MRLPRVSLLLVSVLLIGATLAQDSSEESGAPKRVLKKYRVRRPVIVDEQGNVVRAGPRLRRVRVKNPRNGNSLETAAVISPAPQIVTSTSPATPPGPQPTQNQFQHQTQVNPQRIRQRIQVQNNLEQNNQPQPQPQRLQPQPQPQQLFYEEQGIVEAARSVPTYRQATSSANREALLANVNYKSRGTAGPGDVTEKKVGTTRNYSRINEDGSFTFGYEAEDGSFKEETRGVDCVVRGKYGYIDPEGVRREFEYVSGNPCDPNDPNKEEREQEEEEEDALSPSRPLLRQRVRPTELSENNIQQGQQQTQEEQLTEDQLANFIRPAQRQRIARPNQIGGQQIRQRVRITTPPPPTFSPTPSEQPAYIIRQRQLSNRPSVFQEPNQSLDSDRSNSGRGFNFDSEVQRIAAIHRPGNQPQPLYEQPFRQVQHIGAPTGRQVFGNPAFHQQQQQLQEAKEVSPTPTAQSPRPTATTPGNSNFGRYRTELVYDQGTGQYTSVLVQSGHNNQEFELTQKLRAFSDPADSNSINQRPGAPPTPPSGSFTSIQQFGQPQVQYYHQPTQPQPQQQQIRGPPQQIQPTSQSSQDPSQINQFLARHAYRVHQDQSNQVQPQVSVNNLQFIPPHLRPNAQQTAEIQQQEVREINLANSNRQQQIQQQSANSAAAAANSNGQIDAFLRALNINI